MLKILISCAALVLFHASAQQYQGDSCTFDNGSEGRCTLLRSCQSVYQQLLSGNRPEKSCGFYRRQPVVCCPEGSSSGESTRTSTEGTTKETTREEIIATRPTPTRRPTTSTTQEQQQQPSLPDRDNIDDEDFQEVGRVARTKCAEYAKSVYAMELEPTLQVDPQSVNVSLCAIKSFKLIVGGTKADPKEFPHMVAIGYGKNVKNVNWLCGGTLVSPEYVLTAAHCTYNGNSGSALWARVGDLNLVSTKDDAKPQQRKIVARIRHPEYKKNTNTEYHDIALLKLERPVVFNAYVRPACLPTSFPDTRNSNKAIATGWGRVEWAGEKGTDDLFKVTLPLVPQSNCTKSFRNDIKLKQGIVDAWQICAGEYGRDTCQGDSGGPLAIFNSDHECMYDVIGVTSAGKICGSIIPGVFTRVYNYLSWLERTIWSNR